VGKDFFRARFFGFGFAFGTATKPVTTFLKSASGISGARSRFFMGVTVFGHDDRNKSRGYSANGLCSAGHIRSSRDRRDHMVAGASDASPSPASVPRLSLTSNMAHYFFTVACRIH
jgi:hypothetical protein